MWPADYRSLLLAKAKNETAHLPSVPHDHADCVAGALERAEGLCAKHGARLTKLRRRVLELVWSSHAPMGAYEILRRLSRERDGAAPPTVYRALEFLLEQGLIHRIESLNAFVGCPEPGPPHSGQFLICEGCGEAAEMADPRIHNAIARGATGRGFLLKRTTVELQGLCPACQAKGDRT